ncbi:TPM domain-containing protein [Denitratisoma oestradiolicum]|uniref:TPM domain-containing protein n=1 Tax=Denitratisoma oestradiolicum TaxID=311182 RepID=A0A6S6XVK4_9PROT|nr:TPM domain-containing protein [Denitratisoma oestradiolicum]TWO80082.1 hypothetical protein CBW56_10945 [Denitratisoma oestradiolicum]CAB1370084.1 conserved protein of unknown function [Denitratisoma oestradiolicum]
MKLRRLLKHLLMPAWWARRPFDRAILDAIESAVKAAETGHRGELRFVVEGPLPLALLWRDESARQRATELFSRLRIWDTEENSGVLIYVQLVDRRVEILADRGINNLVPQEEWDSICRGMELAFRDRDFHRGALEAVAQAAHLLISHFPSSGADSNELPDRPLML